MPDLRPDDHHIEMIATITKVLNGFAVRFEEVCTLVNVIPPP